VNNILDIEHDNELLLVLESRDHALGSEISDLYAQIAERKQRIEKLEHYRHILKPLISLARGQADVVTSRSVSTGPDNARPPLAAPGNRGEGMPPRRTRYEQMSVKRAVSEILEGRGELHADEIARAIYVTEDQDDVRRIKKSLVTTLSHGVGEGLWEKGSGRNKFRSKALPNSAVIEQKTAPAFSESS